MEKTPQNLAVKRNTIFKKRYAFTLSEVMLVLSVIGVIAALTIPGIIQNTQNKQTVTQLKKVYSELLQATTLIVADNENGLAGLFADDNGLKNLYKPKLNEIKDCNTGQSFGNCWATSWIDFNSNSLNSWNHASIILSDGTFLMFHVESTSCTYNNAGVIHCGWVFTDLNGFKPPNKAGRDIFVFHITNNGIIPYGTLDTYGCNGQGWGCTSKILKENAVNY